MYKPKTEIAKKIMSGKPTSRYQKVFVQTAAQISHPPILLCEKKHRTDAFSLSESLFKKSEDLKYLPRKKWASNQ